ncbi:OmpP1/FadL family transporter [Glacieibacterium frigidum]|uniref:Transporter n=1 Tax=Glacieibacterium frigidum TaxID=2593303 RepID=A0A552UIS9_9SPHN|nr:porin [Glacieibacterium frigidum]TRW18114.1 transporter [Glacieibacterium frigidum]
MSLRPLLLLAAAVATPAAAGGFFLQEQSPLAVGRAFAGEAAIGDSAATVWYNPAGMTRLPGTSLELGTHILDIESAQSDRGSTRGVAGTALQLPTGGGDGGNPFSRPIAIPSGYLSAQVADSKLWLGLGISAPFGLKVIYDEDFFGRYDSLGSDLKSFNIQPSVAYKISDRISVGAGFDIQTFKVSLTSALPNVSPTLPDARSRIDGEDLSFGWNAGVQVDLGQVRLGGHYRSSVKHTLDGAVQVEGLVGPLAAGNGSRFGLAPLSTPDIATVSAVFGADKLRLLGSVNWYNWSRFERIRVSTPDGTVIANSEQQYRDTWSYSGAVEYDVSDKFTLRAGSMFDQTPTRDEFRTTRVPDGNRIWASTGLTMRVSEAVALNASYAHVFVKTKQIDRTDPFFAGTPAATSARIRSENTGNVDMVAGSVSLRF